MKSSAGKVAPIALWAVLPVLSSANDPSPGQIQQKIDRKQSLIGGHKNETLIRSAEPKPRPASSAASWKLQSTLRSSERSTVKCRSS